MLIKLPRSGPGVRFIESQDIHVINITMVRETARDSATFVVQLIDDKQKVLTSINCFSMEAAYNLADCIATLCNFPGGKSPVAQEPVAPMVRFPGDFPDQGLNLGLTEG